MKTKHLPQITGIKTQGSKTKYTILLPSMDLSDEDRSPARPAPALPQAIPLLPGKAETMKMPQSRLAPSAPPVIHLSHSSFD